jgi:hypothetical protein
MEGRKDLDTARAVEPGWRLAGKPWSRAAAGRREVKAQSLA